MTTTYRLKATRGAGWVQHIDAEGRCSITADPLGAHQYANLEEAERARARLRFGLVPFASVEGPAFGRRTHGDPG